MRINYGAWLQSGIRAGLLAGGLIAASSVAHAATQCPPLGHLPTYVPGAPAADIREFDAEPFKVKKGDDEEVVTVAGHKCSLSYSPKNGTDPLSDREIQMNYRAQLESLGATITLTTERDTFAKLVKDGRETWLHVYSQETEIDVTVVDRAPHKQTLVQPSATDYRLLGHMPNYVSEKPEHKNFDRYEFKIRDGDDDRTVTVEGAKFSVSYSLKGGTIPNSDLDIQTNYRNALAALGAEVLLTDGRNTYARFENKGQSIWVHIYSQETDITIDVIEEKPFQISLKPPEATALKKALDHDGHIALYVNFEFNKATLSPSATPTIAQVVKLLKDDPRLKVEIDGHTDNIGGHDYNQKLSEARAAAIVTAIMAQGIAKDRLRSAGFGPDKPIADNATAEGRAKNRRVELVKS